MATGQVSLYREEHGKGKGNAWSRVAGTCDEMSRGLFPKEPEPKAALFSWDLRPGPCIQPTDALRVELLALF